MRAPSAVTSTLRASSGIPKAIESVHTTQRPSGPVATTVRLVTSAAAGRSGTFSSMISAASRVVMPTAARRRMTVGMSSMCT